MYEYCLRQFALKEGKGKGEFYTPRTVVALLCDLIEPYCVMDEGFRRPGEWALNINSVVVFGRMRIVEDEAKKKEICTNSVLKFTDDEACPEKELKIAFPRVNCLELEIEHMTGKLVNEL